MAGRLSAKTAARVAHAQERAAVEAVKTKDSFQNFLFNLGIGTDNPTSGSTYGFNPISRVHTLLEWIHRGSWVGGVAVDLLAEDMTRAGVNFVSTMPPKDGEALSSAIMRLGLWDGVCDVIKWARLYGGALGVALIDGQDLSTPLRQQTIGKGQFKGILPLDRWQVEPSLNDLVTDFGPYLGLPKYYTVHADATALRSMKVHYSRVLRLEGIRLPYWQRVAENLWGISVLERLYDRMVAFDSATQGAAQLVYRSYLRVINVKDLREGISAGGDAMAGITKYFDMMRRFQGIEGLTLLDKEDEFNAHTHSAFSGMAEALVQFGQQLSGALQIPLVRLFGQSPAGLNASGDSDLRTYYDGIKTKQEKDLRVALDWMIRGVARSESIVLPDNFNFEFNSLYQRTPEQAAAEASSRTTAVVNAFQDGIISLPIALKELRQIGHDTGTFTNITDKDIEEAINQPPPNALQSLGLGGQQGEQGRGGGMPAELPGEERNPA